jgi:hypothetical protein
MEAELKEEPSVDIDLGDVVASFNLRVKGMRGHSFRWHIGPALDVDPQDRHRPQQRRSPLPASNPRKDLIMDLQSDKKVTATAEWTDENGNPTETPADAQCTYTVDDASVIDLTDNGDGSAVIAATGNLGTANVHVEARSGDQTLTGDLQVNVVAGLAERINVTTGEPEEVTPDNA